jgi:hypothetical protein
MNWKQATFISVFLCAALIVPWYAVGMLFMGLAIGAFISAILQ